MRARAVAILRPTAWVSLRRTHGTTSGAVAKQRLLASCLCVDQLPVSLSERLPDAMSWRTHLQWRSSQGCTLAWPAPYATSAPCVCGCARVVVCCIALEMRSPNPPSHPPLPARVGIKHDLATCSYAVSSTLSSLYADAHAHAHALTYVNRACSRMP